jgi:hypothetical protein
MLEILLWFESEISRLLIANAYWLQYSNKHSHKLFMIYYEFAEAGNRLLQLHIRSNNKAWPY